MRISDWSSDVCSSDLSLARAIARGIVARGWDRRWPDDRRQFAYLPLQHSEDRDDQRESLRLFHQLADPAFHDYAQSHFDMIDRFGRFRSEEHTSELQSLMRLSYAVFCLTTQTRTKAKIRQRSNEIDYPQ